MDVDAADTRGGKKSVRSNQPLENVKLQRVVRILSAGAKGGPGKSFVVKNLSPLAAQAGFSVGIVDFDNQRTVTKWLARRTEFFPQGRRIAGYEANPELPSDARDAIAMTGHDIIFIDTPPSIDRQPDVLKTLALGCDIVVVPSKVGISDTESAEVLLLAFQEWNVNVVAFLNQVKPKATRQAGVAKKRLIRMTDLSSVIITDYGDFLTADENGMGATEMRTCLGSDLVEDLWIDVCRRAKIGV